jgi:hypothetical protein
MKEGIDCTIFSVYGNQAISLVTLSLIKCTLNRIISYTVFNYFFSLLIYSVFQLKDEWNLSNVIRLGFITNFSGR